MSQPQPARPASFAEFLAEAAEHLDAAIDTTMETINGASPAEAAAIANHALEELRSAKEAFEADFDTSIERLESVAAGSHEPVPHEGQ